MLEAGVEPATNSLGNCCSIQLSYPSDSFPCFLFRSKQERRKISTFTHRCAPAPIAARKRRQRPHKYSERRAQRQGGKRSFRPAPKPRAHPVLSKYSERRAQRTWGETKFSPRAEAEGASCIIQIQGKASAANVGENEVFAPRRDRGRILYYPNIGKGERSERGGKRSFRPATRPDVPLLPIKTTFYLGTVV